MSKLNLDLKKFKHVKSDDKSTTLQHDDGHIITIAHKPLSKELLKQISTLSKPKDMAEGKEVPMKVRAHNPKLEESKKIPPRAMMAEGGEADDVGYLGSRKAPSKADPRVSANTQDYHDKTSPEQDKQRHAAQDEAEAKGKAAGLYANGGDVPPMLRADDQTTQSFDAMPAAPAVQDVVQDQKTKAYQDTFQNAYDQAKSINSTMENLGYAPRSGMGTAFNSVDKNAQELSANKQAMSAVQIQKEDEQIKSAQDVQQQAEIDKVNTQRQALGLPPIPGTVTAQAVTPDSLVQSQPEAQREPQSQAPVQKDPHDPESLLSSGYNKEMQGISQEASAKGNLGNEQAKMLQDNINAQHQAQTAYQQHYNELEQERQAHMQDIKDGYIDPNLYWKDHSKVMSGIGMILAGFNPTNSPNAAVNFLKYQMDQNIEAQKANLGAKQNLLAHNIQQFGNLRDATEMTRVMQTDILAHNLQMAAAKATSPMAKAAALQAAGKLQMEVAPQFQQFAMRRAMMSLANGGGSPQAVEQMLGYMRVMNPEMAKSMESRYVPGVGLSNVPVPDGVRKELVGKQQFSQALSDLYNWSAKHSGSLDPKAIVEGRTMAANVQNLYREAINGGVFKQGEQGFISNIIDSEPTKFFNSIRVLPKLKEAARENDTSLNILKKTYGLPSQQRAAEPQYKTVNGVKYMRGPKGEAVRVK